MKQEKIFLLVTFLLVTVFAYAGVKETLFDEAISNGIQKNNCYSIVNSENKSVKAKSMINYLYDKDFIIAIVESDSKGNLQRLDFTTRDKLAHFMHYILSDSQPDVKPLKTVGKIYMPKKTPAYRESLITPSGYDNDISNRASNVLWTGDLNNGYIEGTGSGICSYSDGSFTYFEGTFVSGIHISKTTVKYYVQGHTPRYMIGDLNLVDMEFVGPPTPDCLYWKMKKGNDELKKAIQANMAAYNPGLAEQYIKDAKQVLKSGQTPVLSENIRGSLGLAFPTVIFKGNPELTKIRSIIEPLSDYNAKAKEAFYYMKVLDGLWMSQVDHAKRARDYLFSPTDLEFMLNSNYFTKMTAAVEAVGKLRDYSSAKDILPQLQNADIIITEWNKVITADKAAAKKIRNDALWDTYTSNLKAALRSSGGSSNSYSSSEGDVNVENLSLSDFEYNIDKDWYESLEALITTSGAQYKDIVFFDKREKSYKGRIYRDVKDNTYYVNIHGPYYKRIEDAIIASYALEKYGKTRKKGSM